MGKNPYSDLPNSAFWKTGVAQENPYAIEGIYKKKFKIPPKAKIATAGSCFAQHISRHLKKNGYNVLDVEPPPPGLPENQHQKFGFSMYSARYGNIYTVRQLLQLAQEVAGEWSPQNYIWEKNGKFYDALRPAVEPEGLDSPEEVAENRQYHVSKVKELFESLDLFIFTLGLTEMWVHKESGTVYPTAPGTLVGDFDEQLYEFQNAKFSDIIKDFNQFQRVLKKIRCGKPFKCLLTVSPVPLTATASGKHILVSTIYSKSTLRSVAGQLSANQAHIDYFPSFEIVTNPKQGPKSFQENLRSVREDIVENVMQHFFAQHVPLSSSSVGNTFLESDVQCEESILELQAEVARSSEFYDSDPMQYIELLGNSHGAAIFKCLRSMVPNIQYYAANHCKRKIENLSLSRPLVVEDFRVAIGPLGNKNSNDAKRVATIFGGMGLFGDGMFVGSGGNKDLRDLTEPFDDLELGSLLIQRFGTVSSRNETFNSLRTVLLSRLRLLESAVNASDRQFVRWLPAPLAVESVARMRYGSNYFESGIQQLVSRQYEELVFDVFGKYIDEGIVLLPDSSVLGDSGFTLDKYRCSERWGDRHVSPSYYQKFAETIAEDLSCFAR